MLDNDFWFPELQVKMLTPICESIHTLGLGDLDINIRYDGTSERNLDKRIQLSEALINYFRRAFKASSQSLLKHNSHC